ncbi:MAG: hypothetical protein IJB21_07225 [Bacilli bacterium]|nr:hypothetical protein [Bacilli bacterium]
MQFDFTDSLDYLGPETVGGIDFTNGIKFGIGLGLGYEILKQYLVDQYPTVGEINFRKVDLAIDVLIYLINSYEN